MKDGVEAGLAQITASAVGATDEKSGETNPLDEDPEVTIKIPEACTGDTVEVTYDFTEFATLIKADPNAPGWQVKQDHQAGDSCNAAAACSFTDEGPRAIRDAVYRHVRMGESIEQDGKDCGPIGTWDVSAVTNMKGLFHATGGGLLTFNEDISKWDVSNVTNMTTMFQNSPFNGDISGWDTSSVTEMQQMFYQARAFNQPIGNWNVSNVTNMYEMFYAANAFNQNISGWDVSNVVTMGGMFYGANAFNQNLSRWCVSKIKSKPNNFDSNTHNDFKDNAEKQPNWGTCEDPHVSDETDTDNDGIPNDADPDVDGDGIPNTSDNDIDGDGIWNKDDPDIDGDGKTNGIDPDADGDGTPDAEDDTPGGPQ
jgi:surface protein